jgi:BON domain-containing protein
MRSVRRVLRLGAKIGNEDIPSVASRYRGVGGPSGRLVGVRLLPATGEVWLRLDRRRPGSRVPWNHQIWTLALNAKQAPTPTPDAIELVRDMRVSCHDGYIGRLKGLTIDADAGLAMELMVQVRNDVLADVDLPTSPLAPLLPFAGKLLLLAPRMASKTKRTPSTLPFAGPDLALDLDASAEQIASASVFRRDEDITADILAMLNANRAFDAYISNLRVTVSDGEVLLEGRLPSARLRASIEQDVWHVQGVFAVHNELRVNGG